MATIGQTLSAARVAAGCSLEHLSTRTGIRMRILKAIENEDFIPCGGNFYARGHIRRISGFFGIDPGSLLEEYEREHASKEKPTFVPPPRKAAATLKWARSSAAENDDVPTEAAMAEEFPGAPHRLGDDDLDPEQRVERWGHFERNQKLAQGAQMSRRSRRRRTEAAAVPPPRSAEESHIGAHRRSEPDEESTDRHPPDQAAAMDARATATLIEPPPIHTESGVRRHWPWVVVGIILIAAVFVGVRTWQSWEEGGPGRTAFDTVRDNGSDGEEAMGSVLLPEEMVEEPARMVEESAEPTDFTVELTGSGRSWVQVTDIEGEDLFTGFLTEGQTLDYVSGHPLTIQFGNAGMVGVTIDGEDLGVGGHFGEVKELTVDAEGRDG